ncbi:MAG: BMP family ABC transporter substrate-binding protein, partial [Candidatus Thermofonsia Clade 3 bacterium]
DGTWQPGVRALGLAEQGVDYAVDDCNRELLTEAMRAELEAARAKIMAGELVVQDYYSTMKQ